MNRALEASRRNDARAAEAGYREAVKHRPNDVAALSGLAETLFAQNRHAEAITTIEKAWALAPANPQVRWTFGIIMLTNKKRTKEAVAAWEALAKENPEYAEPMGVPERLKAIKKYMEPAPHGAAKAPH
jgi:cytochrome c-type biogenesis protein CcmH/NrfG